MAPKNLPVLSHPDFHNILKRALEREIVLVDRILARHPLKTKKAGSR
jgi:hypothetical protein